jgi:fatty acid desaturase
MDTRLPLPQHAPAGVPPTPAAPHAPLRLYKISHYAEKLKPLLPTEAFAPARSRLLWLPAHLLVVVVASGGIAKSAASGGAAWLFVPLASLAIGSAFAGMTFLAHETLHAAVVRERHLRYALGWILLLPFVMSPRLWIAWHNRVHHGNANRPGVDPDANPTLAEYRANARVRFITDHFALGRSSATGALGLLVGFSVQSAHMLLTARRRGFLSRSEQWLALAESSAGVAVWTALAYVLGPVGFVFAFGVPLLLANTVVMVFIMTNHSLSPLTEINDPLVNALTVTSPPLVEWLTLRFGYHVEHHLFPAMSSRHAWRVRAAVQQLWPERYQAMPLGRALLALHRTGRVYADDTTLMDPRTGKTSSTLLPRDESSPETTKHKPSLPIGSGRVASGHSQLPLI